MPRGGYQPGGGRPKGSANKRTIELREWLEKYGDKGRPEEVLRAAMNDEDAKPELRVTAAAALMPYLYPKRSAVEHEFPAVPVEIIIEPPAEDAE